MNLRLRFTSLAAFALCVLGLSSELIAQPRDASSEETAWFAGDWIVTRAPVEGFEDIVSNPIATVRIEHLGEARIVRHSPPRQKNPAVAAEFTVRQFGKNMPWWSATGGANLVARRVDENTFDLAGVGPMGRAEWDRALRHTRVETPGDKQP